MIAALSKGYQAMGDKKYADAAAADFILTKLRGADGRLSNYMRPLLKFIILKRLLP